MYLFSFSSFAMFLVPAIDVRCTDCSRWPRFVLSCPSAMMHWHSLDLFLSTLNAMNVLGMWVGNTLCDADALELLSLAPSAHCISSAIPPELGTLIPAIYRVASDSFSSRSDRLWMLSASSVCSQAPATIRRLPWPAFDGLVAWRSGHLAWHDDLRRSWWQAFEELRRQGRIEYWGAPVDDVAELSDTYLLWCFDRVNKYDFHEFAIIFPSLSSFFSL